ncbi:MAG: hypothetical protein KIT14_16155 [bacterium]|nr:hypothetical protein [bacterium]
MAYTPLRISPTTPRVVESFVRRHVDMQFHDVHCMLRLPLREAGLDAGCNFSTAVCLLTLISGLSTTMFRRTGRSGERFLAILEECYPWELEAGDGPGAEEGARILYYVFRNPLAHALGVSTEHVGSGAARRAMRQRIGDGPYVVIGRGGELSEEDVEQLETSDVRPLFARWTVLVEDGYRTLWVEGLYWGTRKLVERLTAAPEIMAEAEAFLTRERGSVPS